MFRAMAALAVIGVLGVLGAGHAVMTDAQEARTKKIVMPSGDGKAVVELGEWDEVQQRGPQWAPPQPGRGRNQPGMPGLPAMPGWPGEMPMGGWTVHDTRQGAILLNQMTGESFILRESKEGMHWQPIHRPGMERPEGPRPQPRGDRPPQQPERPNFEEARKRIEREIEEARANMQRKLDDLRGKLKETKNKDERRKISEMIDELESALERLNEKKEEALKRLREQQRKGAPDKDRDEEAEDWESDD